MFNRVMFVVLAWLIASPAFAQDEVPGRNEIIELRSSDSRCPDGYRCFIAGSDSGYAQMLARVNARIEDPSRHVTYEQFVDANACGVIFRRDDGVMRHNGTCSFNRTSEVVSEREFCTGHTCQRWIMASSPGHLHVYRVPAERALTPVERAEQMVERLNAIDPVTDTVPAPAELGGMMTELAGLMTEAQPPSRDLEREVVLAMGRTLVRASAVTPVTAGAGIGTSAALAAANARIEELEAANAALTSERDAARSVSSAGESTFSWLYAIMAALASCIIAFIFGRWTVRGRIINMMPQDLATARNEAKEAFEQKLGGTIENVKKQVANLTRDLEEAKRKVQPVVETELVELRKTFKRLLGMDLTVKNLDGYLTQAMAFTSLWTEPLKGMTPGQLKDEREQAKFARQLRDEWTTMPRLDLKFTVENLTKVLTGWMRLQSHELAWGGPTPPDWSAERLQLNLGFSRERTAFEGRIGALEGDVAARRARVDELEEQIAARLSLESATRAPMDAVVEETTKLLDAKLTPLLADLLRGEFGPLTEGTTRYKVVEGDLVKVTFRIGKNGQVESVRSFLQKLLDGLNRIRATIDDLVGRTPPPNEGFLDGLEDEAETSERPLESEPTRMVMNPLLNPVVPPAPGLPDLPAESTLTFARNPIEAAKLEGVPAGSNGSNGSSDDDATVRFPLDRKDEGRKDEARPRRPTIRGVGFDPSDSDGDEPKAE